MGGGISGLVWFLGKLCSSGVRMEGGWVNWRVRGGMGLGFNYLFASLGRGIALEDFQVNRSLVWNDWECTHFKDGLQ